MVNEVVADMLYESAKYQAGDKHYDPKQLFYRLQLAPKDADFPALTEVVELLNAQVQSAKYSCNPEIADKLTQLEKSFYDAFVYTICSTSSEGGKLIRVLQTQTSEYKGSWEGGQKDKGVQGFFASMNKQNQR